MQMHQKSKPWILMQRRRRCSDGPDGYGDVKGLDHYGDMRPPNEYGAMRRPDEHSDMRRPDEYPIN